MRNFLVYILTEINGRPFYCVQYREARNNFTSTCSRTITWHHVTLTVNRDFLRKVFIVGKLNSPLADDTFSGTLLTMA